MIGRLLAAGALLAVAAPLAAQGVDPLQATVLRDDLDRFIAVWKASGGHPTAAQLDEGYIKPGSRAIEVFTPRRIVDADHLAAAIAANNDGYRQAIERCLPWLEGTDDELRAAYLGLHGLLPEKPLPQIAILMGAGNSGGTAGPGIQVLGLEVLCRVSPDEAAFRALLRKFFVHETVHTLQSSPSSAVEGDIMLASALQEGTADYVASLVTGSIPDAERAQWAAARADWVLAQFAADRAIVMDPARSQAERDTAFRRWFANAGRSPVGWPSELGYWVGMRIAESYVARADDPHAAIRTLLSFDDPAAILTGSGVELPD
ncbi:hypothetical protein [Tsuneonella sp. HG222]